MDQKIQSLPDCQQILEAVSAVLNLEATLVNGQMVRIAGTGPCQHRIGERLHPDSAFGQALKSGVCIHVDNPRIDPICVDCGLRSLCHETAHVASPIFDEAPVGVLGLVAFTDSQRKQLLHGFDRYTEFLSKISGLLGDLLRAHKTLQAVSDSVGEALISTDKKGSVTFMNRQARQLLNISSAELPIQLSALPGIGSIIRNVWTREKRFAETPFKAEIPDQSITIEGKVLPIEVMAQAEGALIVFKKCKKRPSRIESGRIVLKSPGVVKAMEQAERVAPTNAAVLLQGESGTGKELFARAIHNESSRKDGPFIAVNCAAIPENLLESELFGYADGAFTGAKKGGKPGKFEMADRGTLFLDEIGDMPHCLQAKLLRVLQDFKITRVGGIKTVNLDIRIITATNQNLEKRVADGGFREDLFYRLNVIPIEIPPLKERSDDILPLAEHFLDQHEKNSTLATETKEVLLHYAWPGNVRELENAMEYASIMSDGPLIKPDALPKRVFQRVRERKADQLTSLKELERQELEKGIELYGVGEQALARISAELNISRSTVYRRLKEYGLS